MTLFIIAMVALIAGPLFGVDYSHMSHERDKEEVARHADNIRRNGRPY